MKLVRKMTAAMAGVMAVIMVVYAYLSIADHARSLRAEAERDQRAMAVVLAEALAATYDADGPEAARRLLDDVNAKRGHVHLEWQPAREGAVEGEVDQRERSIGDERWLTSRTPIMAESGVVGTVEVAESLADVQATVWTRIRRVSITTLAIFAGAAVVAWFLGARLVGDPVRRLVRHADRLGRGEFDARLAFAGDDELSQLADAMDATALQLAAMRARIVAESEARVDAVEQLRRSERLATVGKLAAGIAHELGTPLNVVLARARMLGKDGIGDADRRRYADAIAEQTVRMARIIRQLLDFARLRPPSRHRVDLVQLVEGTRSLLAPLAEKKGVALRAELPARCPARVDAAQVEQVLTNLIVNAMAASAPGTDVVVRLGGASARHPGSGAPGPWLTLEVEDHGHGIDPEHLGRVFEPFFTTKDVGEGTGLGLAVCYGIVNEHGGFIEVESVPGEGSRFVVHFPADEADEADEAKEVEAVA